MLACRHLDPAVKEVGQVRKPSQDTIELRRPLGHSNPHFLSGTLSLWQPDQDILRQFPLFMHQYSNTSMIWNYLKGTCLQVGDFIQNWHVYSPGWAFAHPFWFVPRTCFQALNLNYKFPNICSFLLPPTCMSKRILGFKFKLSHITILPKSLAEKREKTEQIPSF